MGSFELFVSQIGDDGDRKGGIPHKNDRFDGRTAHKRLVIALRKGIDEFGHINNDVVKNKKGQIETNQ